jgi:hypothetical protein
MADNKDHIEANTTWICRPVVPAGTSGCLFQGTTRNGQPSADGCSAQGGQHNWQTEQMYTPAIAAGNSYCQVCGFYGPYNANLSPQGCPGPFANPAPQLHQWGQYAPVKKLLPNANTTWICRPCGFQGITANVAGQPVPPSIQGCPVSAAGHVWNQEATLSFAWECSNCNFYGESANMPPNQGCPSAPQHNWQQKAP